MLLQGHRGLDPLLQALIRVAGAILKRDCPSCRVIADSIMLLQVETLLLNVV